MNNSVQIIIAVLAALGILAGVYLKFIRPKCKKPAKSGWFKCSCPDNMMISSDDNTQCLCVAPYQMQKDICVRPCTTSEDCEAHTSCQNGLCSSCGASALQPCCEENKTFVCSSSDLVCDDSHTCQPCGDKEESCCSDGSCSGSLKCAVTGTCLDSCGGDLDNCCVGNVCNDGNICDIVQGICHKRTATKPREYLSFLERVVETPFRENADGRYPD